MAENGQIISSGCTYKADTLLQGKFSIDENKRQVYSASLRDVMTDFIRAVEDSDYVPEITLEDGINSLSIALKASQRPHNN
jgi:hypothetical protein